MRQCIPAIALVLTGACASVAPPPAREPGTGGGPPTPRATIQRSITSARISIDSAVRVGSLSPLLAVIDDSTRIVMPSGDTLHGRERIVASLLGDSAGHRIASIQLSEARYVSCLNGAIEWGSRYFIPLRGTDHPDTLRGPYAVRWGVEGDGSLRVRQLMLGRAADNASFRRACVSDDFNRLRDRRLTVWIPIMADKWATVDDLTRRLRRDGYGGGRLGTLKDFKGTSEAFPIPVGVLGLRYRVRAPVSIDVLASIPPTRNTIQAYNPSTTTHVSLTQVGHYAGGMLAVDWGHFRVGAGPFVVTNEWQQRETDIEYAPASGGWFTRGDPTEEQWRSTDAGLIVQGSVSAPVSTFVSIDAFAHYRGFATTEIRATPRRGPLDAAVGGVGIGIAVGVSF